jgi:hypothetical protein
MENEFLLTTKKNGGEKITSKHITIQIERVPKTSGSNTWKSSMKD